MFIPFNPAVDTTKNFTKFDKIIPYNLPKSMSLGAKYLCVCICTKLHSKTGDAVLSTKELSEIMGVSQRQIRRYRNEAIKHGVIKTETKKGDPTRKRYFLSAGLIEVGQMCPIIRSDMSDHSVRYDREASPKLALVK